MILYIILIIIISIFLFINYIAPRIIVQTRGGIFSFKQTLNIGLAHPDDFLLDSKKLDILTKDNFYLSAYLIRTNIEKQKGTIILLHGIRSRKENNLPISKMLFDKGYNSVIIDLRAHGASQGKYCTFGYYEKYDIKTLIDTLYTIKDLNLKLGIWGQSLGGAVSLQVLEIDKRLSFGIVESTFSNFRTVAHDYFRRYLGFKLPSFLTNYIINRAKKIAKFEVDNVKPIESANHISQSMLVVHGNDDEKIKFEYGKLIFNNLASKDKEFISIANSNHSNLREVGGDEYFEKVIKFIEKK